MITGPARYQFQKWIAGGAWDLMTTVAFNSPGERGIGYPSVGVDFARDKLMAADAYACHKMLGRTWMKKQDERPIWIAFLEKANSHPHLHLLVDLADPNLRPEFEDHFETGWLRYVRTGSVRTRSYLPAPTRTHRMSDPHYVTKELFRADGLDGVFLSPTMKSNKEPKQPN